MKSKTIFYSVALLAVASLLTFSSCKKRKAFKDEDGQASEDNRTMQSENDAAMSDINDIVSSSSLKGKNAGTYDAKGVTGNVCGASIDSVNINTGSLKINFDGTTCNNRTRTGSIKITMQDYPNKKWEDAGAVMRVEFQDYKVMRASDGVYVILNGSQLVTNVSGTTWWDLLLTQQHSSIVTEIKEAGGVNVTFNDGKTAVYNVNRRVTYSWINGLNFSCTAEGIGSSNGLSNLENYGTTRDGDAFTSQVSTPIVWNTTCGWWAPVQGKVSIQVADKEFALDCTFSVDASGNAVVAAANTCPYGWKVEWKYKNKTNKKVFGYK